MKLLIIDDDLAVCTSLKLLFKQAKYEVHTRNNPDDALNWLRKNIPHLVLMDMNYSIETNGEEGIELLQKARIFHPKVPVILITGWGSIALAVEGIKKGASDFVSKPWDNKSLLQMVKSNIQWAEINNDIKISSRRDLDKIYDLSGIIGEHKALTEVLSIAGRIASTEATVLISGESGTGKEYIAEAIHRNSKRKDKALIKVNLGGISESLFESEMFGHKKGAFTDAVNDRKGRFQMAEGGSIFLDEIAELSLPSQVKLLRVLQEHTYEILGDSKTIKADVRVICASNKNLSEMVKKGLFREDLYYRINLIHIHNPSLRERITDIPLLAQHFILLCCHENKISELSISKEAIQYLKTQSFSGNIRELKNLMERVVLMSSENTIEKEDIVKYIDTSLTTSTLETKDGLHTLDEIEKDAIIKTMNIYNGNVSRIARALGLSRGALYRRFEKHNIPYEH